MKTQFKKETPYISTAHTIFELSASRNGPANCHVMSYYMSANKYKIKLYTSYKRQRQRHKKEQYNKKGKRMRMATTFKF